MARIAVLVALLSGFVSWALLALLARLGGCDVPSTM